MNSNIGDIPTIERPAFFGGQQLTAADLEAVQHFNQSLRQLHNRSLHNWGLVFGFEVSGQRGERTVQITPGYALDLLGRELFLNTSQSIPIPAIARAPDGGPAVYYLTISYAEDAELKTQTRTGACGTTGAVRRIDQPIIRWQDPHDAEPDSLYREGLDIILATVKVQNCQLVEPVSGAERRDALPAQQPYVAGGQTPFEATEWRQWPSAEFPLGVATKVITTCAGFRTTPRYQAHVVGDRVLTETDADGSEQTFVVDGYAQVAETTAASFELRVILPGGITISSNNSPLSLNPDQVLHPDFLEILSTTLHWYVVWMGVEG